MTTDTKALRERLRAMLVDEGEGHPNIEAADALDRLEAERDAAIEECRKAERLWKSEAVRAETALTTRDGLKRAGEILLARLARMEAALVAADAMRYCTEPLCKNCWPNYDAARAATKEDA